MNLKNKVVKGVIWSTIQSGGSQVISFVVFLVLARLLEPETYGLVALASIFLAFVQVFLDQGFVDAIIQREKLDLEHLDTAFWTSLGISLLLTIFVIASAEPVANLFNQQQLVLIIRWLSLSFLFSALKGVQVAILSRKFAFKALATRSLIANLIGGTVGIAMAFRGFGVWSLVCQQLINGLVDVLVLWTVSDWRPGFNVSVKHFKELFSFGINVMGFNALNFFNRRGDDLLIGYFLGPVALGYYTVAYRLLLVMTQVLVTTTSKVAAPTFSRLQQEPERLRRAFYTATQLSSLITFPISLCVAVLAPELVQCFFGSKWTPSIPVMQVLAFIVPIHLILFYNSSVIMALGKPSWRLRIHCINVLVNVVAFALVVRWGVVAVAAAYVIRGYLLLPISLWALNKLISINMITYLKRYLAPLTGSLATVFTILSLKYFLIGFINLYALLSISITIGISVYIISLLLIAPSLFQQVLGLARMAVSRTS